MKFSAHRRIPYRATPSNRVSETDGVRVLYDVYEPRDIYRVYRAREIGITRFADVFIRALFRVRFEVVVTTSRELLRYIEHRCLDIDEIVKHRRAIITHVKI